MSSFRVSLPLRAVSIDTIRFVDALSRPSIAWRTRWPLRISTLVFVALSLVPGALWSGAITPLLAEKQTNRTLYIPTFQTQNLSTLFDPGPSNATRTVGFGESPVWTTENGLFTFDLAISSVRGTFLGYASSASNSTQPGSFHPKPDQTGYRYMNRSYGVGAAAGLIDIPDAQSPQWYTYYEQGLRSQVTCARNASSAMFIDYSINDDANNFHQFRANGTWPNGVRIPPVFPQLAPKRKDIFVWAATYDARKTWLSIAVDPAADGDDWTFKRFDKFQCSVAYEPVTFKVDVNATARTIAVNATAAGPAPWPAYADALLGRLDDPLTRYSADESMYFGSQLGHALVVNVNQLQLLRRDNGTATLAQGLEDFVASLLDNALGLLSATRLVGASATMPVDAAVGLPAVRYGKQAYIYAVLAINMALVVIFVVEAVRTRLWAGMALLELSDAGSVLLSASEGGGALAEETRGTPAERIGGVRVRVQRVGGEREAIVLEQSGKRLSNASSHIELLAVSPVQAG